MVKPGSRDKKLKILIAGEELYQLQRHTYMMAESFGLDRRVENYKGVRPIGLYRWDVECLLDVMEAALVDRTEYPERDSEEYQALKGLYERLQAEYKAAYEP